MAQENNQISAEEIASAALKGAKKAVDDKVAEPLSKLTSPGDMNPEHMPHPLDDVAAKLSSLPDRLAGLTEPKDMNIANVPHPVDTTLAAVNEKVKTIKAAGPVKGTELAAEMAVGAIIDRANPGKNLEVADGVLDAAGQVRRVEGHLVDEIGAGKGLAVFNEVELPKAGLAKIKEKAADMVKHVPVLGDVVNPDLETRIAIQQHELAKDLLTSDNLARAKKYGNASDVDVAMKAVKDSAEKLTEDVVKNPQLAQQLNKNLTNEQIKSGIVKNVDSNRLTHGSSVIGNYTPDVPPPSFKDFLPMSARDAVHLAILPQSPSPIRAARYEQLVNAEYLAHAEKMKMASVPYASLTYGGGSYAAMKYVLSDDDSITNADLSKAFLKAVQSGKDESVKDAVKNHKELEGAAFYYQSAKNGLMTDDGKLSAGDKLALQNVANNVAEKIKVEGPQVFDMPPQKLTITETVRNEVVQHDVHK